jgi:hypothetical protein
MDWPVGAGGFEPLHQEFVSRLISMSCLARGRQRRRDQRAHKGSGLNLIAALARQQALSSAEGVMFVEAPIVLRLSRAKHLAATALEPEACWSVPHLDTHPQRPWGAFELYQNLVPNDSHHDKPCLQVLAGITDLTEGKRSRRIPHAAIVFHYNLFVRLSGESRPDLQLHSRSARHRQQQDATDG